MKKRNFLILMILLMTLFTSGFFVQEVISASSGGIVEDFTTTTYQSSTFTNVTGWGSGHLELPRMNPVYLDHLSGGIPNNIYISGNYAYTGDYNGLYILDISTPDNLVHVGNYTDEVEVDYVTDCELDGELAYLANGNYGLLILNVTDKANPIKHSELDLPSVSTDILLHNSRAYMPIYSGGLRIVNVANPLSPYDESGYTNTSADAYGVAISGNYLYVAVSYAGLDVFDISTPSSPSFVSNVDLDGYAKKVEISGNYAYVACDLGGLQIVDISDPTNMTRVKHLDDNTRFLGVDIKDNYVFVAGYRSTDSMMKIYDITDPTNPVPAGFYEFGSNAFDVVVSGDYFYVAVTTAGVYSFRYAESGTPYGNYYASYAVAQSSTVYYAPVGERIDTAFPDISFFTESGTHVDFYLSADGGSNWEIVSPQSTHNFASKGRSLQWKAEFHTQLNTKTPILYQITLNYTTEDVELELLYPSNGAYVNDLTPNFDWIDISGAYGYLLQVDNSSSFTNPGVNETLMFHESNYTINLQLTNGSTYYWRVAYYSGFDTIGDYSIIQSFTIGIEPVVIEYGTVPILISLLSFIAVTSLIIRRRLR